MANAKEVRYMGRVAGVGCLVCQRLGYGYSPAVVHHLKEECGAGQRQSNYLVIPLCPTHHTDGGPGVAYHAGFRQFERIYGTELDLLSATIEALAP
jgi:hypothetical protein